MKNQAVMDKLDAEKIRKYCRGCRFFKPELPVKDICNIMGWINRVDVDMKEVIRHVKGCPCNKKCLVKVSCIDSKCPIWLEYVNGIVERKGWLGHG